MPTQKKPRPVDVVKKFLQKIERERKKIENKGMAFVGLTEEQLRRKLGRVDSPIIFYQGWNPVPAGGSTQYQVGIGNPDSFNRGHLLVHVFVGPANPVKNLGRALQCVDARFPRLTQPTGFGLLLPPLESATIRFQLPVPANIEPGGYMGNVFLLEFDNFDVGTCFDRAGFAFEVT